MNCKKTSHIKNVTRETIATLEDVAFPMWSLARAEHGFWGGARRGCTGSDGILYRLANNALNEVHNDVANVPARDALPAAHGDVVTLNSTGRSYWYSSATGQSGWIEFDISGIGNVPANAELDPTKNVSSWKSLESEQEFITPEMFGANGTEQDDTQALLACQRDPRPKHLNGTYKCNAALKLTSYAHWLGSGSIEFNGAGFFNTVDQDAQYWKIGELTLSRIGVAGPVIQLRWGARRFNLMGTRISGSTGMGVDIQGCYIARWTHGYIQGCANHALSMTEGVATVRGVEKQATSTGMNDFSFSGEIQGNGFVDAVSAVYMSHCEAISFDLTDIEGNYRGIELGSFNRSVVLPRYWEGSHSQSHLYTTDDVAQACNGLVLQSGTSIYNKTKNNGKPVESHAAIRLRDVEHFNLQDGVFFQGMATIEEPMIMLSERVGSRAHGAVRNVWHDAPYGFVLRNNTERFGEPIRHSMYINRLMEVNAKSSLRIGVHASIFSSKIIDIDLTVNVSSPGVLEFKTHAFDSYNDTHYTGVYSDHSVFVREGINVIKLPLQVRPAEINYGSPMLNPVESIEIVRNGVSDTDNAGTIEIISICAITYDNLISNKGNVRLQDLLSGDRRHLMQLTTSPLLGSVQDTSPQNMINGNTSLFETDSLWTPKGGIKAKGEWINLHVKGDGAALKGIDTVTNIELGGRWRLDASNDEISWRTLHPPIEFTRNCSWVISASSTNFTNYRLVGISGICNSDVKISDIIPRIY